MTSHYFSQNQTSDYKEESFITTLRGNTFQFVTASGVFSLKKVDKGSELLINKAVVPNEARSILDLGCGYGPVGIAIAKVFPKAEVLLSDVNERAVFVAKKNIKKNNIANAEVVVSDGFEKINKNFDVILLNPPQTAGKQVCQNLIEQSFHHLNNGGTLQIVARHQKGGKDLAKFMESLFGNVEDVAKSSGYRVYLGRK